MLNIIDLTQTLHNEISVYPGTHKPAIQHTYNIKEHGFAETSLNLLSHHGTHMDAPSHMVANGLSLDLLDIGHFYGKAICIDCTRFVDETIHLSLLDQYKDEIAQTNFVLLKTGWSKKWVSNDYLYGFPVLSNEACNWLTQFKLKGIGLDAISIDKVNSGNFENHRIILGKGMIIIENLTNLEKLGNDFFTFSCFPLKYNNADGSPVRAVAIY